MTSFAKKFRPLRFGQVRGQHHPVRFLSGLIRRGQVGRSLLLHGSIGSGKTSLVRIYAQALNCENPDPEGSPCLVCRYCVQREGFHEYDTSGQGGEKDKVLNWIAHRKHPSGAYRWTILFFDEAQALESAAADALLKAVEEPENGVLFCFATTELERIRPALRSRLYSFEIKPLQAAEAIALLTDCAHDAGIKHEPGALELLAGLRQGQPRDLLNGLEQVRDLDGQAVTVERVRETFDVDHTEHLLAYAHSLAEGDYLAQERAWFGWNESAATKIGWLQALLTGFYYNNVLGLTLTFDALISSIQPSEREPILASFRARLRLKETRELGPHWRAMMAYWPLELTKLSETALQMHIALFHEFVNEGLPAAEPGVGMVCREQRSKGGGSARASSDIAYKSHRPIGGDSRYLTATDAHNVVESASFFTQEYGGLFNVRIRITPALLGAVAEEDAVNIIAEFCEDLDARAARDGAEPFARLSLLERDLDHGGHVTGRIIVHLPLAVGQIVAAGTDSSILAWIRSWRREHWLDGRDALIVKDAAKREQSLKFHWDSVLDLCAGLDEEAGSRNSEFGEPSPLLDLLGVPEARRRRTGGIAAPLLGRSDLLGPESVTRACANGMRPLSALAANQWRWIRSGWELREHQDRTRTKAERSSLLARTAELYSDTNEHRDRLRVLALGWERPPEDRPRQALRGWWLSAEA